MSITLNPWPFDGQLDFQKWRDELFKNLPGDFFNEQSAFIIQVHGVFDYWTTKLFDRDRPARDAAQIIARGYYLHKIHNQFFN